MEDKIKELEIKLNKIIETQGLILSKLDQNIIIPNPVSSLPKTSKKKHYKNERVNHFKKLLEESFALAPYKSTLQQEFNLATKPHNNRVKAYLKTKDPSVFDGLKRN
tara:strand:- start:196 stop:516 length:321 start_codon:yes stop_codon:yes gene_type:complete